MQTPLQIRFHGMESSRAFEPAFVRKPPNLNVSLIRIRGLPGRRREPHRHHRAVTSITCVLILVCRGKMCSWGIRDRWNHAHEDVNVAIRDAFNAAARQVEDHTRRMRGAVSSRRARAWQD